MHISQHVHKTSKKPPSKKKNLQKSKKRKFSISVYFLLFPSRMMNILANGMTDVLSIFVYNNFHLMIITQKFKNKTKNSFRISNVFGWYKKSTIFRDWMLHNNPNHVNRLIWHMFVRILCSFPLSFSLSNSFLSLFWRFNRKMIFGVYIFHHFLL